MPVNSCPESNLLLEKQNGDLKPAAPMGADEEEKLQVGIINGKPSTAVDVPDEDVKRETWGKKADFLLSIIGFAVDLANLWRFPYLCYSNGGGAFLVPYFLMLILGALPLFYMELILGQYHQQGAISLWRISPLFKGIGWASVWMAWVVAFYYNVLIGWAFFYMFASMQKVLPWVSCDNSWNTDNCVPLAMRSANLSHNKTINESLINGTDSAVEYFEYQVLGIQHSSGVHDLGIIRWPIALATLLSFVILYFALWKGVASSGKVVWVTATAPYIVLTILLIRGVLLPGAADGILYFITPKLKDILKWQVWIDAANQIFYSVGAGFGVHLAYASYNKFNNNCYRDCLVTAAVNSFTSLYSGFVVFSYLGYMAYRSGRDISKVVAEGPGLVFTVYPEAVATLPGSQFWSIIFFLLMLTLGLDSAMGGLEAVITGLKDEYKKIFERYKYSREILVLLICIGGYLFALINTTQGGLFMINILDKFSAGTCLLFTVFLESVAVAWIYGLDTFCADAKRMLGFVPGIYWRICWKFISPAFVLFIVVASIVVNTPLSIELSALAEPYVYPDWATTLGWLMFAFPVSLIPANAIYQLCKANGSFKQRLALTLSPQWEHDEIRNKGIVRRFQKDHWLSLGNHVSLTCNRSSNSQNNVEMQLAPNRV